jgi:GNAT superfamily N-acetyltransferase
VRFVNVRVFRFDERPELDDQWSDVVGAAWPEFMQHDPVVNEHWHVQFDHYPECQIFLVDEQTDLVVGVGNTMPTIWDGTLGDLPEDGIDEIMRRSVRAIAEGHAPNVLCALQAVVRQGFRGRGLSTRIITEMAAVARRRGDTSLIAPMRPTEKWRYPLAPLERYARWRRDDGLPFDAWIRVHVRLGGEILKVAPSSMRIEGSVAEWTEWAQMAFPESGDYVVPQALVPITIDRERDLGTYLEPNLWMRHAIGDP